MREREDELAGLTDAQIKSIRGIPTATPDNRFTVEDKIEMLLEKGLVLEQIMRVHPDWFECGPGDSLSVLEWKRHIDDCPDHDGHANRGPDIDGDQ